MTADLDWGQTREAQRRREEKAQRLAVAAWAQGYRSEDIPGLDAIERRHLVRVAGVNAPGEGSPTWDAVHALLVRKDAWAQRNPEHPDVLAREPRPDLPIPTDAPSGWAALAAQGHLADGARCTAVADCGREAVAWVPSLGRPAARCAGHPPLGEDWGSRLDWTPKPCLRPGPCWCHRHRPGPPAIPLPATEGPILGGTSS